MRGANPPVGSDLNAVEQHASHLHLLITLEHMEDIRVHTARGDMAISFTVRVMEDMDAKSVVAKAVASVVLS